MQKGENEMSKFGLILYNNDEMEDTALWSNSRQHNILICECLGNKLQILEFSKENSNYLLAASYKLEQALSLVNTGIIQLL